MIRELSLGGISQTKKNEGISALGGEWTSQSAKAIIAKGSSSLKNNTIKPKHLK